MATAVEPWIRERLVTGGGPAEVSLIALSSAALPDPLPVSAVRHGVPEGEGAESVTVSARDPVKHAAWFEGMRESGVLMVVAEDLGEDAVALARGAEHALVIEAALDDALDLTHLQAAWGLAACACEHGATIVIDLLSGRAFAGADVAALAPDRPFDISREIAILVEPLAPDRLAVFTRGLVKVGRTDLIAMPVPAEAASDVGRLLRDLAGALAAGDLLEPEDTIQVGEGTTFVVAAPPPDLAQRLGLDQPALVLTPR